MSSHEYAANGAATTNVRRLAPPPRLQYSDLATARQRLYARGGERDWFATGAIEGAPLVVLCGPEKTAKSWALQHLAAATIVGGSWLGCFPIQKPGHVVVVENEYGEDEYVRRIIRICKAEGWDEGRVIAGLHHYDGDFSLLPGDPASPLQMLHDDLQQQAWGRDVRMVQADPLRNYVVDENSTADIILALENASRLRRRIGGPVLVTHHLNKAGNPSGARAIRTRADLIIEGSDTDLPRYESVARTMRTSDKIRSPFRILVTHEHDDDDRVAKSLVRASFDSEQKPGARGHLSEKARRVLDYVDQHHPVTKRQMRDKVLGGLGGKGFEKVWAEVEGKLQSEGKGYKLAASQLFASYNEGVAKNRSEGRSGRDAARRSVGTIVAPL